MLTIRPHTVRSYILRNFVGRYGVTPNTVGAKCATSDQGHPCYSGSICMDFQVGQSLRVSGTLCRNAALTGRLSRINEGILPEIRSAVGPSAFAHALCMLPEHRLEFLRRFGPQPPYPLHDVMLPDVSKGTILRRRLRRTFEQERDTPGSQLRRFISITVITCSQKNTILFTKSTRITRRGSTFISNACYAFGACFPGCPAGSELD